MILTLSLLLDNRYRHVVYCHPDWWQYTYYLRHGMPHLNLQLIIDHCRRHPVLYFSGRREIRHLP